MSTVAENFGVGDQLGVMVDVTEPIIEFYAFLPEFQVVSGGSATASLAMLQGIQVLARAKSDVDSSFPIAASYIDSIDRG